MSAGNLTVEYSRSVMKRGSCHFGYMGVLNACLQIELLVSSR